MSDIVTSVVTDLEKVKADAIAEVKAEMKKAVHSAVVAIGSRAFYTALGSVATFVVLRLL